jgi:hypothetical protein
VWRTGRRHKPLTSGNTREAPAAAGAFLLPVATAVNNFAAGVALGSEDRLGCGLGGRMVLALEHVGVLLERDRGARFELCEEVEAVQY